MRERGQATVEYAFMTVGVIIPMTFGIIFLAQMLWVWNGVVELTRDAARYAATHCYQGDAGNVMTYVRSHLPPMVDQQQFQQGNAQLMVNYYSVDPASGQLTPFSCDTECSPSCVPDTVTVQVSQYQFQGFFGYLHLQPVSIPSFQTSVRVEGAGCDPEQGFCTP